MVQLSDVVLIPILAAVTVLFLGLRTRSWLYDAVGVVFAATLGLWSAASGNFADISLDARWDCFWASLVTMLVGSAVAVYAWYRDRKLPMEHPRYYPNQIVGIAGAIYGLWLLSTLNDLRAI